MAIYKFFEVNWQGYINFSRSFGNGASNHFVCSFFFCFWEESKTSVCVSRNFYSLLCFHTNLHHLQESKDEVFSLEKVGWTIRDNITKLHFKFKKKNFQKSCSWGWKNYDLTIIKWFFNSSLHWFILGFLYALFIQWSFFEVTDCVGGMTPNVSFPQTLGFAQRVWVKSYSRPKKCYFLSPLEPFWLTMTSPAESWTSTIILHCTKMTKNKEKQVKEDYFYWDLNMFKDACVIRLT